MITAILAAISIHGSAQSQAPYHPTGPKIVFTMQSGGSFTVTTDPKNSPLTTKHILDLVKKGFYDRQRVHRVETWVTQWGSPASKKGQFYKVDPKTGGPVIDGFTHNRAVTDAVGDGGSGKDIPKFEMAEVDFDRGVVGIASNGLQLPGDSQLFVLKKNTRRLYHSYAVLGLVTSGMDVVGKIMQGDRIKSARVVR